MTETQHPRRIGRSIVALLMGIFVGVILTVVTDIVLHVTGVFPPLGQPTGDALLLAVAARRGCRTLSRQELGPQPSLYVPR